MDNYHEQFIPEQVDEQIEQLAQDRTSLPHAQFVRDLGKLYEDEEEIPTLERVWERLASHLVEHDTNILFQQLELLHNAQKKGNRRTQQEWTMPGRAITTSRFAQVVAVLFATLLVGSLFWTFHLARSSTSSGSMQQASSPGIYVCCTEGELEKIDAQTHKIIWHTHIPTHTATSMAASSGNHAIAGPNQTQNSAGDIEANGNIVSSGNIIYLPINNSLYAYNAEKGNLLWLHIFNVTNIIYGPYISIADGQPYAFFSAQHEFMVLNPADGTIRASYKFTWFNETIADNILYYTDNRDLYALHLPDKKLLWHQQSGKNESLSRLTVQNGVVYAAAQLAKPRTGLIYTFDAHTGNKLWQSSQFPGPIGTIIPTDDKFYVSTVNSNFYAFDIHTHTQIWHQSLDLWENFLGISTILYNSGILYLNIGQNSPVSVLALSATDGKILWKKNIAGVAVQLVYHGILYCFSTNTYKRSILYAFNTNNGSQLWQIPIDNNNHLWLFTVA